MRVNVESSIVIDRPVEEVFDFIAVNHRENHSLWDVAVSRLEPEGDGPMGIGTRFTIVRRNLRREEARGFTVSEWDPPRLMTMRTSAAGFDLALRGEFQPLDEGRSRHTVTGTGSVGGLRGLLVPLMKVKIRRDLDANLRRVKSLLEVNG